MECTLFRLRFESGYHLGVDGFGLESCEPRLRSDALFGALCSAAAKLYGGASVGELMKSGNILVSSCFPFVRDVLFFPMPFAWRIHDGAVEYKRLKKAAYMSLGLLARVLNSSGKEVGLEEISSESGFLFLESELKHDDCKGVYVTREIPRVVIDRVTNSTELFYFSETFFRSDSGLYFLARTFDRQNAELLRTCIGFLADEGIGADRTCGKGLFTFEEETISIPEAVNGNSSLLLSLYIPASEEINSLLPKESYYEIEERGGWVTSLGMQTLHRRRVRAFREGSVLVFRDNREPKGCCPIVLGREDHPQIHHPVFRYMQAFSIPYFLQKDGG
ncbi:MAG: type III-A CRISPR-associated RAMP protein Csm4 [Bacteroidota bacterium]|nr:type III-A CRISPR-associated RAMP protein Csm4 [Bacteroidota bacterium]